MPAVFIARVVITRNCIIGQVVCRPWRRSHPSFVLFSAYVVVAAMLLSDLKLTFALAFSFVYRFARCVVDVSRCSLLHRVDIVRRGRVWTWGGGGALAPVHRLWTPPWTMGAATCRYGGSRTSNLSSGPRYVLCVKERCHLWT